MGGSGVMSLSHELNDEEIDEFSLSAHELSEWPALEGEEVGLLQTVESDAAAPEQATDPFEAFDDLPKEARNILTLRALVVGIFCGALVNASNIYLGLKSGWTAGASIFASIVGFTTLKALAKHASYLPLVGGDFGPRENNIVQTAATAAGGMSGAFVSAIPAMYQMGLLESPAEDYWRLVTISAVGGLFGFFFATPLRKFFIIDVARELNLIFPSALATATTIRNLHAAGNEASQSSQDKMRVLSIAFSFALLVRVVSQYAIGLLWDWHPFAWLFLLTKSHLAIGIESWGWYIEWTPAFIGTGILVGSNVALSYLGGSLLAWGIIGPTLVSRGLAFGTPAARDDPAWDGLTSYYSLSQDFASAFHPSPRYWLLWPGILCMVVVAFVDLACQWRVFYMSGRVMFRAVCASLRRQTKARHVSDVHKDVSVTVSDSAAGSEQIPTLMWVLGLIASVVLTCVVMSMQFNMPVPETCLAMFLTVFFSFLAIQTTGASDITPLTGVSKASQMILGASTSSAGWSADKAQLLNLLGGSLADAGAAQATDLIGDFRVGFLLRTSPLKQWMAQGIGTLAAVFIAPTTFVLFASAYPCINRSSNAGSSAGDTPVGECAFHTPAASAWSAVAVAVTEPTVAIPPSSQAFAIVFALIAAALVLVKNFLWTGKLAWLRAYHPNMMIVPLAFVIPATVYGTAMAIGALIGSLWAKRNARGHEAYSTAVAAGLMAGEGIGGVTNAILQVIGLSGEVWGSTIGCPAGSC